MFRAGLIAVLAMLLIAAAPIPLPNPRYAEYCESASAQQKADTKQNDARAASPIAKNAGQAKHKAAPANPKQPDNWFKGWGLSDEIAVIASVVAFLQFAALVVTVRVMNNSAKRQLRAYVHLTSVKLTKPPSNVTSWQAIIDLRNSGQTPAYSVVVTFEKGFRGELESAEVLQFSDECHMQGTNVIGPNCTPSVTMDFSEVPNDWADWAILRDANEMAYLWGRIDYVDAFGHKRFTTFQVVHHFGVIYDFVNCPCGNVTEFEAGRGARHVAARKQHSQG